MENILTKASDMREEFNNVEFVVFPSALRSGVGAVNSVDIENFNARGVCLFLNVTTQAGTTPTLIVKLQAKDPIGGAYIDIPAAVFATVTTTLLLDDLTVYPGILVAANVSVNHLIPRKWRAVATLAGTSPAYTFSLGGCYIL
jgi:hypothetical protein